MALLKAYALDGTPSTTVTTGNSGFIVISTTPPSWDSTGTALECTDGGSTTAMYCEDQTTGEYEAFVFSIPALPSGGLDMCILQCLNTATSLASIRIKQTTGFLALYQSVSTLSATGTYALSLNTKYRIERQCNASGQTLRLYTETGTTVLDTISGTVAAASITNKRRIGHPQTAQASGLIRFDNFGIYDAWPDLGVAAPTNVTFSKTVTIG